MRSNCRGCPASLSVPAKPFTPPGSCDTNENDIEVFYDGKRRWVREENRLHESVGRNPVFYKDIYGEEVFVNISFTMSALAVSLLIATVGADTLVLRDGRRIDG